MLGRWRYVVVGAFVVGAVLTPPDCLSQIMLASCLLVLYGIGLGLSYAVCRHAESDSG
jgi:sec-independent protein translocase protein TatC